jgi:hypothetical protein
MAVDRCHRCGDPIAMHDGAACTLCPCGSGVAARLAAEERAVTTRARNEFDTKVQAERRTHAERGFTAEHDDEHGLDHLLMWAQEYAFRGEAVKSASMIEAAREKLIRDRGQEPRGAATDRSES